MDSWSNLVREWGDCVIKLHNRPFYSIVVLKDEKPSPKMVRVKKSYYELSISAAGWGYGDFNYGGVIRSEAVNW